MKKFLFFTMLFVSIFFVCEARADVAPRAFNRSGTILSGEKTEVSMNRERVVFSNFRIEEEIANENYTAKYLKVDIKADFTMKNNGSETEEMKVYFPFYFFEKNHDYEYGISDIRVFVNEEMIEYDEDKKELQISFDVIFPGDEEVNIRVEYASLGGVNKENTGNMIGYVLESGAGWKNEIGYGEVVFELPYNITEDNFNLKNRRPSSEEIEYKIEGSTATYVFENFEPTEEDNLIAEVFNIDEWEKYLNFLNRASEDSLEVQAGLANFYQNKVVDHKDDYYYHIEKVLEIKHPIKDLVYYEEASKYYSNEWYLVPGGIYFNFYTDVESLIRVNDELTRDEELAKEEGTKELIEKNYIALFKRMIDHLQRDEEIEYSDYLGDAFVMKDGFEQMVEGMVEKISNGKNYPGYYSFEDEFNETFLDYLNSEGPDYLVEEGDVKEVSEKAGTGVEEKQSLFSPTGKIFKINNIILIAIVGGILLIAVGLSIFFLNRDDYY